MTSRKRVFLAIAVTVLAASCSSSDAEPSSTTAQGASGAELTITAESDGGSPAWEDFVVEVAPVVLVEQITAIGDPDENGNVPLGTSCNELLVNFPDLTGCREEVGEAIFEQLDPVEAGTLGADGTLTIPAPTTEANVTVFAVSPEDELCTFSGLVSFRPDQTEVTVFVDESCA